MLIWFPESILDHVIVVPYLVRNPGVFFPPKLVPGKHSGPRNRSAFTGREPRSFFLCVFFAKLVPGKHSGPRNRGAFTGQESGSFFLLSWFPESILDHVVVVPSLVRNREFIVFFLFFFC